MSTEPKRLSSYGDRLDRIVKGALDAERASDVDAARLAAIEAKLASRLAPPPPPPAGARPALWAGAAMIVAGVAIYALSRTPAPPAPLPPPPPAAIASVAPAPPEPVAIPTISPSDLPSAREPQSPSARTIPSAPAAPTETEEIALIARAQEALASDPAASLALCREHGQRFANGHFAQEREAVAIEALVDLHRTREANERFDAFALRYPTSSHRAHLEDLLSKR